MSYLVIALIVFAVNLLPAFGPPTWAVLVFVRLHWHLQPVALVVEGALSATSGRYLLARFSHHFKNRLPRRLRSNLEGARDLVERKKIGTVALFALFLLSPLPSAQLFVAAGLLDIRLRFLTAAFLVGRLVSYSIYVTAATLADRQLGGVLGDVFGSPWSIALQGGLLALLCALPLVDWRRIAQHRAASK